MLNAKPATPWNVLVACLETLEQVGENLRAALMAHNPDAIWSAVESQAHVMKQFEQFQRQHGMRPADRDAIPSDVRENINSLITRTRSIQRVNRSLTRVFLDAIDGAFASLGSREKTAPLTYSARGGYGRSSTPIFVQQTG